MAKINLLPWREAYRKEKKEQFLIIVGAVLAVSALIAYLWVASVESSIENQKSRNHMLDTAIADLDQQVKEISELKKVRDDLLARIKIIQDLEGTRPLIVRYFDDLARSVPDGVYLTLVQRQGDVVTIEGVAESYNRVASFMRNLEASDWFSAPNLTSVVAAPQQGDQANSFKMTVHTSTPNDHDQSGQDQTADKGGKDKSSKSGGKPSTNSKKGGK